MKTIERINGCIKAPSLCWDCQKATGGCDWSREFRPVEGWTAQATTLVFQATVGNRPVYYKTSSFHVIECPEFEKDDERYFERFFGAFDGEVI